MLACAPELRTKSYGIIAHKKRQYYFHIIFFLYKRAFLFAYFRCVCVRLSAVFFSEGWCRNREKSFFSVFFSLLFYIYTYFYAYIMAICAYKTWINSFDYNNLLPLYRSLGVSDDGLRSAQLSVECGVTPAFLLRSDVIASLFCFLHHK